MGNHWRFYGDWGKFIETVKREAFEEAGIEIKELTLFGIYSGEDRIITYRMEIFAVGPGIILKQLRIVEKYKIIQKKHWNIDFFDKTNLPDNINKYDKQIIIDWTKIFSK